MDEETLSLVQVAEIYKILGPASSVKNLPPNDPSLPDDGNNIRLNLQIWAKILDEPIETRNQKQQRIGKILYYFIRLGILNNLESSPCVNILMSALRSLESGANISESAVELDLKAKIAQLTTPAKTNYERITNLRKLVIHGLPLLNIWDAISFLYTVCAENINTPSEAQHHHLQFRIIILSLRAAHEYFSFQAMPTTVAATWTRSPPHPQPLNIAFATTAAGAKRTIAAARREFMKELTKQLKKIPPSAITRNSPNLPGNCPEYITWGIVCREKGKYSTLCLNMSSDPEGKIYKCCSYCEELRRRLKVNSIEIEDIWKDSVLGCSEPVEDEVEYPYCLLGIKGKIGAAIYDATKNETRHRHLGKDTQYNVYTAELAALQLAIETLRDDHEQIEWRIFTDSQAAIKATDNPHRQSGQAIIKDFLDRVDDISDKYPHLHIKIIWIPGHAEIEGNERADAEAKKAAIQSSMSRPYNHRPLKSARIRVIKEMARKQWDKEWNENSKTAKALRRITKRKGAKTGPKLYNEIPGRDTVAKIVQLRTGHCGLNHYLHRFGKRNSPYCECGMGKETVEHYLLECRRYKEQRKKMIKDIGKGRLNIERLLGQPQTIKYTIEFIRNTKRLES